MKTTSANASPLALSSLGSGSAAAHTPGPWMVRLSDSTGNMWIESEHEEPVIQPAYAFGVNGVHEETALANARLIAAAPDLLNALRAVMTLGNNDQFAMDYARAAIAKAEGGK